MKFGVVDWSRRPSADAVGGNEKICCTIEVNETARMHFFLELVGELLLGMAARVASGMSAAFGHEKGKNSLSLVFWDIHMFTLYNNQQSSNKEKSRHKITIQMFKAKTKLQMKDSF